jgi:ABC-type ATPase with predicted acetyltransferase domain
MVNARYKPITPDKRIRELRKDFKALSQEEPSAERAQRLAAFTREAHADRQLNMAMHTAQLCIEDDPDDPALLVAAYLPDGIERDGEAHLRALTDLADLARYIDRPDLRDDATGRVHDVALAWIEEATEPERRHRLRTLMSMFDRAFVDAIRDESGS